ncbi:hypothetical protein L596_009919 [Steinernema carpocapsae]|uniref:Uncharacterized protein n=1 Tax=Steinernema carpocapsae TaxID=34508 RepID=A0A4U5PGZ3_STECR|nr:hypothetical protein L596_009919 [Steinernema carpocapsae]
MHFYGLKRNRSYSLNKAGHAFPHLLVLSTALGFERWCYHQYDDGKVVNKHYCWRLIIVHHGPVKLARYFNHID